MHLLGICLFLVLAYSSCFGMRHRYLESEWINWKTQHGKQYHNLEEELTRKETWKTHFHFVQSNRNAPQNFKIETNILADKKTNELTTRKRYHSKEANEFCNPSSLNMESSALPSHVDWRELGYVTPVVNQGDLGGSWAYSAVGSLEGQNTFKTGRLVALSTQNLEDCCSQYVPPPVTTVSQAFECIHKMKGIDTEEAYPASKTEQSCKFDPHAIGATVSSCQYIPSGSEMDLQFAVARIGPISVGIDAGHTSFQLYDSGIYYEPKCSNVTVDHDVLVVGYGNDNGTDYWIVKNSWGDSWGEKGYIRMARNRGNNCGIATMALFPFV